MAEPEPKNVSQFLGDGTLRVQQGDVLVNRPANSFPTKAGSSERTITLGDERLVAFHAFSHVRLVADNPSLDATATLLQAIYHLGDGPALNKVGSPA